MPTVRVRTPRTFAKHLKHAWKPFPVVEQVSWGFAAARFLKHGVDFLRPDAYVRLSDLNNSHAVPPVESNKIIHWVKNDHLHRFEVTNELERVEGKQGWHQTWYIRTRSGHSVPGVDITTTRIRHASQISSLVFATTPENWPAIGKCSASFCLIPPLTVLTEKRGLRPEIPNLHSPQRSNPHFTYFAQDLATLLPSHFATYPAKNNTPDDKLVQLHIGINVEEAMNAGIKFFRNRHDQVISTGLEQDGGIPNTFFNNVFVVALEREMLLQAKEREEEKTNKE